MIDKQKIVKIFKDWQSRLGDSGEEEFTKLILKAVIDKIESIPEESVPDINVGHKNCVDCRRRKWYKQGYADGIAAVKNCSECSGCPKMEDDGK